MINNNTFPLSNAQKRIWYAEKMYRNSSLFNIGGSVKIYGNVDIYALKKAICEMIEDNEALRFRFIEKDGEPMQYICSDIGNIDYMDFSMKEDSYGDYDKWCAKNAAEPFIMTDQMYYFTVFRITDNEMGYFIKIHHIVADGWSMKLLTEQVINNYERIIYNREKSLTGFPSYTDYIFNENQYLSSEKLIEEKKYWLNMFNDLPDVSFQFGKELKGERKTFIINDHFHECIKKYIDQKNISLNIFFIGVYLIYSYKKRGERDIVIGMPLLGRKGKKDRQTLGTFVNTMPFRYKIDPNMSVNEMFSALLKELRRSYLCQMYPYNFLREDLKLNENNIEKLFDVCINYYNTVLNQEIDGYAIENTEFYSHEQEFALQIIIRCWQDNKLQLDFDYQLSSFTEKQIDDMYHQMLLVIEQIINSESKMKDIVLINEEDKQKFLFDFNNTKKEYDFNKTWLDLFEDMAKKNPDKTAVSDDHRWLTYGELDSVSNGFAQYLQIVGMNKDDIAAVILEHNLYSVATITAIMKCGAVYLPVDVNSPIDRMREILKDSGAKFLLAKNRPDGFDGVFISLEELPLNRESERVNLSKPSELAYIIYTSGSTGTPKGVMVSHKNIMNYLYWSKDMYIENENEVFALFSSFAFDFTMTSILLPLISGGEIRIYSGGENTNIFKKILEENRVTIAKITPSHIPLINDVKTNSMSTKSFIVGGEDLKTESSKKLFEQYEKNINIYNEYGPTETTVGCMIHRYNYLCDISVSTPIGKPINNTQIYLLDKDLKPVPYDTLSEIYISGESVSNGYIGREEETKERFITDPNINGEIIYKTGDMAYRNENGDIVYVGRYDNEIKIRGNRVNLKEIEKKALSSGFISDVTIKMIENTDSNSRQLCLYVIENDNYVKESFKEYLINNLPNYMIPQFIIPMSMFPLTVNGKIDKNKLPKPIINAEEHIKSQDKNKLDVLLNAIYDVIAEKCVSGNDNFYAIGGDSIKAIQISSRLVERGYELSVRDILTNPIIDNMAEYIKEKNSVVNNQSVCLGVIEKTPIMEWFFEQNFKFSGYYDQSIIFELSQQITKDDIELAFYELINHHDILRLNYDKKEKRLFYNNSHLCSRPQTENIDFSIYEWEDYSEKILSSLNKEFNIEKDLLLKLFLIQTKDSKYLCATAHHLIMDSVSWRIIIDDLVALLSQIKAGLKINLPNKTSSYQNYAEEYIRWAKKQEIDKNHWEKIINEAMGVCFKAKKICYSQTRSSQFLLSTETTSNLMTKANEPYNTKTNELLMIALCQAVYDFFLLKEITIEVESHGRDIISNTDVSRTVGWFTNAFPVCLHIDSEDLKNQITSLKEQLIKATNRGYEYGILRYINKDISSDKKKIRFNFLGEYVEKKNDFLSVKQIILDDDISADNEYPFLFEINIVVVDKRLFVKAVYPNEMCEQFEKFLDCYKDRIIKIVENCMSAKERIYTPSDFELVDLTQEELDSLIK